MDTLNYVLGLNLNRMTKDELREASLYMNLNSSYGIDLLVEAGCLTLPYTAKNGIKFYKSNSGNAG